MTSPTESLSSIRTKLNNVENEIKFLEELLIATSGPAKDTIAELNMLKDVQSFYRNQYHNVMKEYEESKKNDSR
jgi:spore coat polysaccharide biosynthesis protein SpsF (cytidylyltransferase family)